MGKTKFPPSLRENDYPSIGQSRGGYTLVCQGDDSPSEWADWLDPIVSSYVDILGLAEAHGVSLTDPKGGSAPSSLVEFCEAIGIDMAGSAWQGQMISGTYWLGWLRNGTLRGAKSRARSLVASLSKQIDHGVRKAVLRELDGIRDLDSFLERTADDRPKLKKQLAELQAHVRALQSEAERTAEKAAKDLENDTHRIDRACLDIACAIIRKHPVRIVAGPLVLWDDGIVYAIVSRGKVEVPRDSSAGKLIDALTTLGHTVVRVRETTVIGGWTNGPILRKGASTINGWATVWIDQEKVARRFEVDPPDRAERVREIHRHLSTSAGSRPLDQR